VVQPVDLLAYRVYVELNSGMVIRGTHNISFRSRPSLPLHSNIRAEDGSSSSPLMSFHF